MQSLPITPILPQIREALHHHTRLVLQAPPGAGKTTALPLALLDAPWLAGRQILMLEPRRLAARASAARMAQVLGEQVGERVGYRIRMEARQSAQTQILIVTEGILTRMLQSDLSLEGVGLVIFDEFHERSLHADLALALSLEAQSILREDLRILIMSATLNTTAISTMLGDAPLIRSEGRAYPVERIYLDPQTPHPRPQEIAAYAARQVRASLEQDEGNILLFLPGVRQIQETQRLLSDSLPHDLIVAPLYGNLPKQAQDLAIAPPPPGKRKVVLATNIAQTSLTIEGIGVVIDSGLENVSIYDPATGMSKLETRMISQDAATQRAGRAGRLFAGRAYHLWHAGRILSEYDTPEILSADLAGLVLELAQWGCEDPETLTWLDLPPRAGVEHARALLTQLGALEDDGRITPHGRAMSRLGLHPRLAHMVLRSGELDRLYEASLLAVLLTHKEIYTTRHRDVDLRERVEILHDLDRGAKIQSRHIDRAHGRTLLQQAEKIRRDSGQSRPRSSGARIPERIDDEVLGVLLAFAYPDRIAQLRHPDGETYLLRNSKGARLHPDDPLRGSPWLVVADLDGQKPHATIYRALPITLPQIEAHHECVREEQVRWNEEQSRVEVREVVRLGSLILGKRQLSPTDNPEVTQVLLTQIEAMGLEGLGWSKKAKRLQERGAFLHLHRPEFPDLSESHLLSTLAEWLGPYLEGMSTLREVQALDLLPILQGLMSYEERQTLDRLAPARLRVPSGSLIPIDYHDPTQPILAVRLQEMFGTTQTPTVLEGQIPLMLHLLSPAHRPMQMTQDLASFWANTYDEVKKELRGRYKKHYWPDDPLAAVATSRVKKRM